MAPVIPQIPEEPVVVSQRWEEAMRELTGDGLFFGPSFDMSLEPTSFASGTTFEMLLRGAVGKMTLNADGTGTFKYNQPWQFDKPWEHPILEWVDGNSLKGDRDAQRRLKNQFIDIYYSMWRYPETPFLPESWCAILGIVYDHPDLEKVSRIYPPVTFSEDPNAKKYTAKEFMSAGMVASLAWNSWKRDAKRLVKKVIKTATDRTGWFVAGGLASAYGLYKINQKEE